MASVGLLEQLQRPQLIGVLKQLHRSLRGAPATLFRTTCLESQPGNGAWQKAQVHWLQVECLPG